MGSKKKLQRFAELEKFPNVFQNFSFDDPQLFGANMEAVEIKGKWSELYFKNSNPIILELACGGGEYAVSLATKYPDKNFIGVDIKGARIYKGAKIGLQNKLPNLAFLRCRIEKIQSFFDEEEINEIWITFPDPFLKDSSENRRLTSPPFLKRYKQILSSDHIIHLKTDSSELYEYTTEVLANENIEVLYTNDDIYKSDLYNPDLEVKTAYEIRHLANGLKIKYIQFKLQLNE